MFKKYLFHKSYTFNVTPCFKGIHIIYYSYNLVINTLQLIIANFSATESFTFYFKLKNCMLINIFTKY